MGTPLGKEVYIVGGSWGWRLAFLLAVTVMFPVWAVAEQVLFDNGMTVDKAGATSDADGDNPAYTGQQVADDFMLTSGGSTVTDVEWVGNYVVPGEGGDPGLLGLGDRFTLIFYADDHGLPGETVARYEVGRVPRTVAGNGTWLYRYALPAPLPLRPDTPYHLAIVNRIGGATYWCWGITGTPGINHSSAINPVEWYEWPSNCAFRLLQTDAPPQDRRTLPIVVGCVFGVLALRRYVF